ncbi:hypothetical protein [Salinarimonas soli]|uniref:Uncharacterized protein n=1 Tax=Salinarimonas soli TaxID=1638099 RepID=A0A5B2VGE3_9HYPH|nr:hypothetical protein [Salinarimonas soli]KAA2237409.1 hypothetical protein F0L46_10440 [Salinarimonas soli]
MASTVEAAFDSDEELARMLQAFGRDLDPVARSKVLAFLHLLRGPHAVDTHFAIGKDGAVTLVIVGQGEAGDPMGPLLS